MKLKGRGFFLTAVNILTGKTSYVLAVGICDQHYFFSL